MKGMGVLQQLEEITTISAMNTFDAWDLDEESPLRLDDSSQQLELSSDIEDMLEYMGIDDKIGRTRKRQVAESAFAQIESVILDPILKKIVSEVASDHLGARFRKGKKYPSGAAAHLDHKEPIPTSGPVPVDKTLDGCATHSLIVEERGGGDGRSTVKAAVFGSIEVLVVLRGQPGIGSNQTAVAADDDRQRKTIAILLRQELVLKRVTDRALGRFAAVGAIAQLLQVGIPGHRLNAVQLLSGASVGVVARVQHLIGSVRASM